MVGGDCTKGREEGRRFVGVSRSFCVRAFRRDNLSSSPSLISTLFTPNSTQSSLTCPFSLNEHTHSPKNVDIPPMPSPTHMQPPSLYIQNPFPSQLRPFPRPRLRIHLPMLTRRNHHPIANPPHDPPQLRYPPHPQLASVLPPKQKQNLPTQKLTQPPPNPDYPPLNHHLLPRPHPLQKHHIQRPTHPRPLPPPLPPHQRQRQRRAEVENRRCGAAVEVTCAVAEGRGNGERERNCGAGREGGGGEV